MDAIGTLKRMIQESQRIVFLGGAGVSTESGIPDYRGTKGRFKATTHDGLSPEERLSRHFFLDHTDLFYRRFRANLLAPYAFPNAAHLALARLEQQGKLLGIITQNIDGLHQKAGSKHVMELHGSVHRYHCMGCKQAYGLDEILNKAEVPLCDHCGQIIRPDVVLYEEMLDPDILETSIDWVKKSDMLIIGGTSLKVHPAAGLVRFFGGAHLVIINKTSTDLDHRCDLLIQDSIGHVLSQAIAK